MALTNTDENNGPNKHINTSKVAALYLLIADEPQTQTNRRSLLTSTCLRLAPSGYFGRYLGGGAILGIWSVGFLESPLRVSVTLTKRKINGPSNDHRHLPFLELGANIPSHMPQVPRSPCRFFRSARRGPG